MKNKQGQYSELEPSAVLLFVITVFVPQFLQTMPLMGYKKFRH